MCFVFCSNLENIPEFNIMTSETMEFFAHPFPKDDKVKLSVKFNGGRYIMIIVEESTRPAKPCWNSLYLRLPFLYALKQTVVKCISPGQGPLRFTAFSLMRKPDLRRVWTSNSFSRYYGRVIVGRQFFYISKVRRMNRGSKIWR